MSANDGYDMEASFLYPINYNFILNQFVMGQWYICHLFGLWGLVFYNDGGDMWNECFTVGLNGGTAEFFTK